MPIKFHTSHQQFGCLVWGMELHRLSIQTLSDIATVQKGEGPRTCHKLRCVRWVLGDVPVVQPHQQFGCLVWGMELHRLSIQTPILTCYTHTCTLHTHAHTTLTHAHTTLTHAHTTLTHLHTLHSHTCTQYTTLTHIHTLHVHTHTQVLLHLAGCRWTRSLQSSLDWSFR